MTYVMPFVLFIVYNFCMVLILANIVSAIGLVIMLISTRQTTKNKVLGWQSVYFAVINVSMLLLDAMTAVVQNLLCLVRNILAIYKIDNKFVNWALITAGVVLGIVFNTQGLLGWLPILATLVNAVVVINVRASADAVKWSIAVSTAIWMVYNFFILNYVSSLSNLITVISTVQSILAEKKNKTV